jgi:hypothetical protein
MGKKMINLNTGSVSYKLLTRVVAVSLMGLPIAHTKAADQPMPEGLNGWVYVTEGLTTAYASTPEEACKRSAMNHLGSPLLDMSGPSENFTFGCKYRN